MLSGAVVAGDGGSSSIYYNPANISEAGKNSNLSLSAVMFSLRYYKLANGLGNGISPETIAFVVQPRFITYIYNPPKGKITLGASVFTRVHERIEINYTLQKEMDILKSHPGNELYNAYFDYRNRFDDTWVGIAAAYDISSRFHVGVSFFVSSVSMQYLKDIENSAQTINDSSMYSAIYNTRNLISYNNFRGIFKVGISYKLANWRFGLNITAPSFTLLSISKKLIRTQSQDNITYLGKPLPDKVIFMAEQDKGVLSRERLPLSISAGFVLHFPGSGSHVYFSIEHFFRLKPYLMLEAYPHPRTLPDKFAHRWLSVASGSKKLTNIAVGYNWKNANNVGFMLGFRTDFNYLKNYNFGKYAHYNILPYSHSDNYHLTGGAEFSIFGQRIISGVEFTFSKLSHQKQLANFSNPVEYNPVDKIPLQGPLENNASMHYYSVNLYLSAILNFGGKKGVTK